MTPSDAPTRAAIRASEAAERRRRPAHARSERSHRILRALGLVMAGVLAFGVVSAGAIVYTFQNNITAADVSGLLGDDSERPPAPTPDPEDPSRGLPVNILLMGSDDRSGANAAIGGNEEGMRSDTTLVMHISADRSRVELVSIPRDSLVDIPSCTVTGGQETKPRKSSMFNSAFATGWDVGGDIESAAACAMRTVESVTDVRLDGFVVVDFAGFQSMIDAIGGIPMCIPEAIKAKEADLYLSAGEQTLNGQQALGLARARKGTGANFDGSDINRIGRQQELLAATARTVLDKNILVNAPALLQFLDAATSSLTASPEFASIQQLTGLAYSMRGISGDRITFMTVPHGQAKSDKNRVVWTREADKLWENMAADRPIVEPQPVAPTAPGTGATTPPVEAGDQPATPDEPAAPEQKQAGQEAFTSADTTAVCN